MRRAELVMALALTISSLYLMWKSAELRIGWIPDEGPGGGFWPFWLSAIMLVCSLWIIVRWFRKVTPLSRSADLFMDRGTIKDFLVVSTALIVTVALFYTVGVYVAIPLFIIFYVGFLGRHSWMITGLTAVITPVILFFFFEIALKITLPKGYTEPAFYPLYRWFL